MGKTFTTSRVGCTIIANYNDERSYTLNFSNEKEAQFFESELIATQDDFWTNGRDAAIRKKSMFSDPKTCKISMNFDTANISEKWPMVATLSSADELKQFYADLRFAIWGPMPSV